MVTRNKFLIAATASSLLFSAQASAAEIERNTAQMQAMDKITGRVSVIEVPVNSEVAFGSFSIVVRACKTTPPEETPENYAFVDVADSSFGKMPFNIFKGWMMSSSPALNAVEHPIYDVWLLKCIDTKVDKSKLLSDEQLKERDALPKLADIKQEAGKTADQPAVVEEAQPEQKPVITEDKSEEKVLEDFTKPAELNEQKPESATLPLADENKDNEDAPMAETQNGPQSLLNIEQSPAPELPLASEPAVETDWVELPPSGEAQMQTQPQAAAEAPSPLIMQEAPVVESENSATAGNAEVSETAAETDSHIPESLPEDEEDQFIDLSSEAAATAALEAELSAEALKE